MLFPIGVTLWALAAAPVGAGSRCAAAATTGQSDPLAQAQALTACYERACQTGQAGACRALREARIKQWMLQYGAVRVGGPITPPRRNFCVNVAPDPLARQPRCCSSLSLSILVDVEGRVREAQQISDGAPPFPAVVEAVKQWEYSITRLENGKPVPVIATIAVPFPPAETCAVVVDTRVSAPSGRKAAPPVASPKPKTTLRY
ncbi:MAG: hypothetical protein MUF51_00925 [Vicinamibacteria bacterium]|nr:hypothetical protein [Vicinamibacteria bacterium]